MPIPPIAAGNIAQVTIECQCEGQTLLNVLHYRAKIGLPTEDYFLSMSHLEEAIAEGSGSGIVPAMTPLVGLNVQFVACTVQRIAPARSPLLRVNIDTPGGSGAGCDAINVAAVITKRGEVPGRGKSGTFHLGGLARDTYLHGVMTEASLEFLATLADKLNDEQVASGTTFVWEPVIFNPGGESIGSAQLIVFCGASRTLRVMRRRTIGYGI